jgi:RNA-directed DNA polymerase
VDVGEMQRKFSQRAEKEPTHQFGDLYSLLCNIEWLREAHRHVNKNAGRETAGVDGVAMRHFNENLEENLGKLREALKAERFEPVPVRRVYIPKANGKRRPLGIPSIADRIIQEALRMILEPIWESDFSRHSYGCRPNRSTYDAISSIGARLTGRSGQSYQWVIEGDITSYFDTIPHKKLMKAVKQRVADGKIRNLLWKFLRAGVLEKEEVKETLTGTPQGGIISPLLANIYLHKLDKYMASKHLNLSYSVRNCRRKQGKGNFLYVRYADDFIVLCNGKKAEALGMKEELGNVLAEMGLKLSEEKTKVTHITEGFTFLGYKIIRSVGQSGKMAPKVLIAESAIRRFRHKIREMIAPSHMDDSVNAKILALNRVIQGWCQYYRVTSSPMRTFRKAKDEVFLGMAHALGRKFQISMPVVMQRFREGLTFRTKSRKLVLPTEIKTQKLRVRTWHNPYTATEPIIRELAFDYEEFWNGNETRHGWMDLRDEVIRLKGTTCNKCGKTLHPSEVQVDHITPRKKFKDPRAADHMDNQQVLCTLCHRAKTKRDQEVLSRMR